MSRHSLDSLGTDVLVDHVLPYLDIKDVLAVAQTCRQLYAITQNPHVWHDLFERTFGLQPNPYTVHKWPEVYRWRRRAGLYTWGNNVDGRLGYKMDEVPAEKRATRAGVSRPHEVKSMQGMVISDVTAGGFSFAVLAASGEIYAIGVPKAMYLGPRVRIGGPGRIGWVRPGPFLGPPHMRTVPPGEAEVGEHEPESEESREESRLAKENRISDRVTRLYVKDDKDDDGGSGGGKTEFVSLSQSRTVLLALDSRGRVWCWDEHYTQPGRQLRFAFDKTKRHKIRKICAGWNTDAVLADGVGIAVWHKIKGSIQSSGRTPLAVEHVLVPGTNNTPDSPNAVIDVVVGSGFLVYLDKSGRLYLVETDSPTDITSKTPRLLADFMGQLADADPQAQFTSLSGQFTTFAAMSDRGHVYIGHFDTSTRQTSLKIYDALQHVGCISVAAGDYHYLALLKGGKLLAWGSESESCGCFGLGGKQTVLNDHGSVATTAGRNVVLNEPTPVPIDGHVVAIAAAGWQSAAVIVPSHEPAPSEIAQTGAQPDPPPAKSCPVGSVDDLRAKINAGEI